MSFVLCVAHDTAYLTEALLAAVIVTLTHELCNKFHAPCMNNLAHPAPVRTVNVLLS